MNSIAKLAKLFFGLPAEVFFTMWSGGFLCPGKTRIKKKEPPGKDFYIVNLHGKEIYICELYTPREHAGFLKRYSS